MIWISSTRPMYANVPLESLNRSRRRFATLTFLDRLTPMFVWTLGFVKVNDCTRKKAAWGMGRTRSWMVSRLMFLNEFSSVFQWSSHSVSWVQYQMSLEVLKSLGHRLTDPCFAVDPSFFPPVTACHGDGKSMEIHKRKAMFLWDFLIKWESPWPLPCKWLAEASCLCICLIPSKVLFSIPIQFKHVQGGNQFLPWLTYLVCEDSCLISNYFVRTYPLYQPNEHDDNFRVCDMWCSLIICNGTYHFSLVDQQHDIPSGYVKIAIENGHL